MDILLVNPPNSGRSIPEDRYGIDSLKQIFRGEPLALEVLAGNLDGHIVRIIDLKADETGLEKALAESPPDLVGITGVTCEANSVLSLAGTIKEKTNAIVVVGGIHASNDPLFFNVEDIDFIAVGLAKAGFRELITCLEKGQSPNDIPGIIKTTPGNKPAWTPRSFTLDDLVDDRPPRYDLVESYREKYTLSSLDIKMGFVVTAFGCPFRCNFCCISALTQGRYLTHRVDSVLRDINTLKDIQVIRLLDANTFGNPEHAAFLAKRIAEEGIRKQFLVDVRSDTVVNYPVLMKQWQEIGLRAAIIGFEEISDQGLAAMNKTNRAANNTDAIRILHDMGVTIVGDFIVSPDYEEKDFAELAAYIEANEIDLPMITVMTPLPGTVLYKKMRHTITIHDLDYYTLTNAVTPTRLPEEKFYRHYADLIRHCHAGAKL